MQRFVFISVADLTGKPIFRKWWGMISASLAKRLVKQNAATPLGTEFKTLCDSLGSVLAEDVFAPISLPVFDNAAMDGFCFRSKDTSTASLKTPAALKVKGEVKAGDGGQQMLQAGEAYRIMTGAALPKNADAVLAKENAVVEGGFLLVARRIGQGNHVRSEGEEIKKGSRILRKGSLVRPATVGILAALGKKTVKVFRKPRASLIVTGSELAKQGTRLAAGRIYDSNSPMLESALRSAGIPIVQRVRIKDDPQLLKGAVRKALKESDVLILAGGVSVGEHDYVKSILWDLGVKTIFWKVNQKPGKPLFFGTKGRALVFGLPGNPAAAFTCFYEYVFPALRLLSSMSRPGLERGRAEIQTPVQAEESKTLFLKAKVSVKGKKKIATPLRGQSSHMISSLQDANCFVLIPPVGRRIKKGKVVEVDFLPDSGGAL